MCLAIPAQIVRLLPESDLATADVSGVQRTVNVALLSDHNLAVGDWVLIHVGFAISKVDEVEARTSLEFLESMGQAYRDEIDALMQSEAEEGSG
ncbi:MAG: HypC/HybG/HupF family hydrogenase formation chaperone [Candidatus Solibacter sp.]